MKAILIPMSDSKKIYKRIYNNGNKKHCYIYIINDMLKSWSCTAMHICVL